ncbi:hypothetical protein [Pirellula sp. SH-Sr6A]|uniref:hypothetical protein n=1 Tax=Pirellula sp. SH-Sr6A TaxID=1632865 RepID=UPI0011BA9E64|nr:hypothetical protein [Pirellula sp. SH-Sr6A]
MIWSPASCGDDRGRSGEHDLEEAGQVARQAPSPIRKSCFKRRLSEALALDAPSSTNLSPHRPAVRVLATFVWMFDNSWWFWSADCDVQGDTRDEWRLVLAIEPDRVVSGTGIRAKAI